MDKVSDVAAVRLTTRLFFPVDKMPVRVQPAVSQRGLPLALFHVTVTVTVRAQTERAATNRYSALPQGG